MMDALPDTGEFDERQQKLFHASKFLGKLLLAGAAFQLLLFLYPSTYSIQAWFAELVAGILQLMGVEATSSNHFIYLESGVYRITQDCLGWKSMAAFTGLIFASGSLRKHHRFLFAGVATLFAANIVRVTSTVYLSHTGVISFEIIHGTLWRWGLTAVVLVLWLYWARKRGTFK